MKSKGIQIVQETPEGLYVWEMPDKSWIANENGDWLTMAVKSRYDKEAFVAFTKYVKEFLTSNGHEFEGRAVFLPGHRQVSDEEYEEQVARQAAGLVPDKFDVGAAADELRWMEKHGR